MKNFFRKLFFWDDPAGGVVFALFLNLAYSFSMSNLSCLSDTFFAALQGRYSHDSMAWMLILFLIILLIQLLMLIYCAFLYGRFFYTQDRMRYKVIFWGLLLWATAGAILITEMANEKSALIFCGAVSIAGFNALSIRKNNYLWYIFAVISWVLCLPGFVFIINSAHCFEMTFDNMILGSFSLIDIQWRLPIVYAGVGFFLFAFFSQIKLWAAASGKRWKEVWGINCHILLFLTVLSYLVTLSFALYEQHKSNRLYAELEKNFQKKLTCETLKKEFYCNRRTDQKFHDELKKAITEFDAEDQDLHQISMAVISLEDIPEKYQQKFFAPEAEKIGKFFDNPLPAPQREYLSGNLSAMLLSDLSSMREAARFFTWQMKIASRKKDRDQAMKAWRRSENISEFLLHDGSLIASLVVIAMENIRLVGLKAMLQADILSSADLINIQQYLQKSAAKMPEINRRALFYEAVFGIDTLHGMANGSLLHKNKLIHEGLKGYRFLAPGLWYLGACNYSEILRVYNRKNLCMVKYKPASSPRRIFAAMLIPALDSAGKRMHEMEMIYQANNALIEAVRIKRTTGKFPEKLPLAIKDHFSGKLLQYKIGTHEVEISVLAENKKADDKDDDDPVYTADQLKYKLDYRTRKVQGAAVWSVGKNKLDDHGFSGRKADGQHADDMRALLIF